jgi:putative DNA primase/helicase
VARLKGARFVSAVEAEEGRRLAEAFIKQAAGGVDTLTARFLHAEWFDFQPQFKVWLATNHKPVVRGTDNAIWDRIRLIPFTVRIPEGERDKTLPAQLRAELPGIPAWAVRGCLLWQTQGLDTPREVREATDTYRAEMDVLAGSIEDRCVRDGAAKVEPAAIYKAFCTWCEANGEKPLPQRTLGLRLEELGFAPGRSNGKRWWHGMRLGEEVRS